MTKSLGRPLKGLQSLIAEVLRGAGITAPAAADRALRTVSRWCANYGGVTVYLPSGKAERLADRDMQIAAELKTAKASELACRYGLSEARVRQIGRRSAAAVNR